MKMETKSEHRLVELIKSLNKNERGYFKKYSHIHGYDQSKSYLLLFDYLVKSNAFEIEKITLNVFKPKTSIKTIRNTIDFLYINILKSLTSYYQNINSDAEIKQLLLQVDVLFNKMLFKQAHKVLLKAKNIAKKTENNYSILQIINWEKRLLIIHTNTIDKVAHKNELLKDEKKTIDIIKNNWEYHVLNEKIYDQYLLHSSSIKSQKRLILDPLLQNENNALSNYNKALFYQTKAIYYHSCLDAVNSYNNYLAEYNIYLTNSDLIKDRLHHYFSVISNLSQASFNVSKPEEGLYYLSLLEKTPNSSEFLKVKRLREVYPRKIFIYMQMGKFKEALDFVSLNYEEFESKEEKINVDIKMYAYFDTAKLYFAYGDFSKTLYWLNKLILIKDKVLVDLKSEAKLLLLIVYFETESQDLFYSTFRSFYRDLLLTENLTPSKKIVLDFLKKTLKLELDKKKLNKMYSETKANIDILKITQKEEAFLSLFDFSSWLESKIQNRPMIEIMKEKVNSK